MQRYLCAGAAALVLTAAIPAAHAADGTITTVHSGVSTHRSQGEVRPVGGSAATLITSEDGAFVSVSTDGLAPGHAHTMWFVAINNPGACETRPCTSADVTQRTEATDADIGFADGLVVRSDGTARFATHIPVGGLGQTWFGNGFHNASGAEIHVTIADHGPVLPGLAGPMTSTYRAGCTDDSLSKAATPSARADGEAGPNTCKVVQFAVFQQPGDRQAANP